MKHHGTRSSRQSIIRKFSISIILFSAAAVACFLVTGTGIEPEGEDKRTSTVKKKQSRIYGIIERMPADGYTGLWAVGGYQVVVSDKTTIEEEYRRAAEGRCVIVNGAWNNTQFTADDIEVEHSREHPSTKYMDGSVLYGTLEVLPQEGLGGVWRINAREILVNEHTKINAENGEIAVGIYVEVEGHYVDSTFTAYEVNVKVR